MYVFYAAPSSFGEGSLQSPKSCPSLQSNFGRNGNGHQLESVRTGVPHGKIKRELQDEVQSFVSENARLCGWQFRPNPYFGARYPCPTMSFISRRYLHDLKTSSFPSSNPMATRLEQPDIFLGKPKGLSGEGRKTTNGCSGNTHSTRGTLDRDSEPLKKLREPKAEQFPERQAVNSAKKGPQYRERRRRNNLSAKKSRDARKFRQLQLEKKLVYIENENIRLRREIYASREENFRLKGILGANCDVFSKQQSLKEKSLSNERLSTTPSVCS